MKIVLAGASGLIGSALTSALQADGHVIRTLVRRTPATSTEAEWHPERGELDPAVLRGYDAVVCLSGAGIGDHRWSERWKQTLFDSRLGPTGTLARTLGAVSDGPRTLIAASAVGFYGDSGDQVVTEASPSGTGFQARLCQAWEAVADEAVGTGIRVVKLRTGLVLSGRGGFLGKLVPLYRLGLGGRLGTGRQYMPWITLDDHLSATKFLLGNEALSGPFNLVGPAPATNAEFNAALGSALHRPAVLRVPGFAMKLAMGEMAELGLAGARAVPQALTDAGFEFSQPDLGPALESVLRRVR